MELNLAIQAAADAVGGQAALARRLGVSPGLVNQWVKGRRQVAVRHCVAIERMSGVNRRLLRPEDWQDYWPVARRKATDASPAR